jgi:dihydrolipoamide dehydrogenase
MNVKSPGADSTRLAVIGAGPGGYAAAFLAADLGLETTLIDPAPNPGGVCLYRGCIPSKALLHVARVIAEAKEAERWGVHFGPPQIDIDRVRQWKREVVDKLTSGLGTLAKTRHVRHIRATARFAGDSRLTIRTVDGKETTLAFENAILATGSGPIRPKGLWPSQESRRVMDSTAALEVEEVPARLLVVGGGYIGLEIGSVYAALGSAVTVVEMTGGILPGVDKDLVRPVLKRLKESFAAIFVNTRVASLEEGEKGVRVAFAGEQAPPGPQDFDRVLVSVGRRPRTEDLGLENTRVVVDEHGFVRIDQQRRTDEPGIFAVGDIAGQPMLAHKASHEAKIAVQVIAGRNVLYEPRAIPAVVFTDPEIAWCGMTEEQARNEGRKTQVTRFPWPASGRAVTLDRIDGLTKLVIDAETERILGMGIVGSGAGELIAEGVLAVEMGATAEDVALSIHPHPTISETIMEAAEAFFGQSTHVVRAKRA